MCLLVGSLFLLLLAIVFALEVWSWGWSTMLFVSGVVLCWFVLCFVFRLLFLDFDVWFGVFSRVVTILACVLATFIHPAQKPVGFTLLLLFLACLFVRTESVFHPCGHISFRKLLRLSFVSVLSQSLCVCLCVSFFLRVVPCLTCEFLSLWVAPVGTAQSAAAITAACWRAAPFP